MSEQSYSSDSPEDPTPSDSASSGVGSIVDSILDLDELLSGDVRRARKTVQICIKPWLEADLDRLEAELNSLTDERGEPLTSPADEPMATSERTAYVVANEYRDVQREYAAAMRSVVLEQMPQSEWATWQHANETKLENGDPGAFNELIVKCAVQPEFTLEKLVQMRERLGHSQVNAIANGAWAVNTRSGVSVPKSSLSSHVLRRLERARN